jgi:hypothetical protein
MTEFAAKRLSIKLSVLKFREHKPWKTDNHIPIISAASIADAPVHMPGFDGLDTPLTLEDAEASSMEMKWQLADPNTGDYIVYTSADTAWLLS